MVSFDLSSDLGTSYPATSPNLLASFIRIVKGEQIGTRASATSQAFYVIQGRGSSDCGSHGAVSWAKGDLMVLPKADGEVVHSATEVSASACHLAASHLSTSAPASPDQDTSLYWVSDAPLLSYLGVAPVESRFNPTLFRRETLLAHVETVRRSADSEHKNRLGILLSNRQNPETKTLSHTLWSLLNCLPAGEAQKPHKHNSVALDVSDHLLLAGRRKGGLMAGLDPLMQLAVEAGPGVYTLMGPEIDEDGSIVSNAVGQARIRARANLPHLRRSILSGSSGPRGAPLSPRRAGGTRTTTSPRRMPGCCRCRTPASTPISARSTSGSSTRSLRSQSRSAAGGPPSRCAAVGRGMAASEWLSASCSHRPVPDRDRMWTSPG